MVDHFEEILILMKKLGLGTITIEELENELVERKLNPNARSSNKKYRVRNIHISTIWSTHWLNGRTPIVHIAAAAGMLHVVQVLYKHGVDLDSVDQSHYYTSLMWAGLHEHEDIVRMLVKWGVNINAVSVHGMTALSSASVFSNWEMVHILARITPGTMSLRPKESNHILKTSQMVDLLNSPLLLDVTNRDYCALRRAMEDHKDGHFTKQIQAEAAKAVLALWNLEQTRHFLKRDDPELFAKFALVTEEERFNVFLCIEREGVKHRLFDPNLLLVLEGYI